MTYATKDPTNDSPEFPVDSIGGVDHPRFKAGWGPEGTVNEVDDASGKRIPVKIAELKDPIVVVVTPTLHAADSVAANALLADSAIVAAAFAANDRTGILRKIIINDEDNQGAALDIMILNDSTTLGSLDAQPTITDANARGLFQGIVPVAADQYSVISTGLKIATIQPNLEIRPKTGTDDFYFAVVVRGAGTYTASGLRFEFHVEPR